MEIIIAITLFVAIVAAWIVLPSAPGEHVAGHSAAPSAPGSASPMV
jgi:hypothetical protein